VASFWRVFGEWLATSPRQHAIVATRAKEAPLDADTVPQFELFDVRQAEPAKPRRPAAEELRADADRAAPPTPSPATGVSLRRARDGERALRRLCVKPDEAAEILGVSRDFFDEHIKPELRIIRRGSKTILIPLVELERWVDQSAARWS
jgi:hypothetical protein